ncbi:hypothetical protein V1264_021201 [Littorina saxatilis]|uniref:Uncharacterized protein n=1 Tax=Littorina saxatilis TaxID=31220 RepID=A0AAN9AHT5_9CAEN
MTANKLQLNDSKTESMLVRSQYRSFPENSLPSSIHVGDSDVNFVSSVTNLGVTFDHFLNLSQHVQNIRTIAYSNVRKISSIRHYLTPQAAQTLACSLVLSRIDYCNSLFYGCDQKLVESLQKVQNSAAKLIYRSKKFDHVTPLLRSLHWLPVSARIRYKLACICFSAKFEDGPKYLKELLVTYDNPSDYNLRSRADSRKLETCLLLEIARLLLRLPLSGILSLPPFAILLLRTLSAVPLKRTFFANPCKLSLPSL